MWSCMSSPPYHHHHHNTLTPPQYYHQPLRNMTHSSHLPLYSWNHISCHSHLTEMIRKHTSTGWPVNTPLQTFQILPCVWLMVLSLQCMVLMFLCCLSDLSLWPWNTKSNFYSCPFSIPLNPSNSSLWMTNGVKSAVYCINETKSLISNLVTFTSFQTLQILSCVC